MQEQISKISDKLNQENATLKKQLDSALIKKE